MPSLNRLRLKLASGMGRGVVCPDAEPEVYGGWPLPGSMDWGGEAEKVKIS